MWSAKCVAELTLLGVCMSRRVRAVWLLGGYSFITTLGLMLVVERSVPLYMKLLPWVDRVGTAVMVLVFIGLLHALMCRQWVYVPLSISYIGLLLSQMVCTGLHWHDGTTATVARLHMLSWMVAIALMAMTARLVPRLPRTPMLRHVWRDLTLGD